MNCFQIHYDFKIIIKTIILLNLLSSYNNNCYGTLLSNSKMSDICWGDEDIFVNPQNIPLLLYYFRSCLQATELLETSDKQNLLNTLSERINSVIPEVKFLYFNGNVEYDIMENFYDLINEIKFVEFSYDSADDGYLQPSQFHYDDLIYGYGYRPRLNRSPQSGFKIQSLKITAPFEEQVQACESLIFKNKTVRSINPGDNSLTRNNTRISNFHVEQFIPVPVLHVVRSVPRSLAIPLKTRSIYSVSGKDSKDVLVRYYVTSMKCLSLRKRHTRQETYDFNKSFCAWIEREILSRALKHEYYPAFTGVAKIIKTMEEYHLADECVDRINRKRQVAVPKTHRGGDPNTIKTVLIGQKPFKVKINISNKSDYDDVLKSLNGDELNLRYIPSCSAPPIKFTPVSLKNCTNEPSTEKRNKTITITSTDAPLVDKFSNLPTRIVSTIFAFLIALLLATWVVCGSLCIACCLKRKELSGPRGKVGTCPYDQGESVIIMMKDEQGKPKYFYGTFHVDKSKLDAAGFDEAVSQCRCELEAVNIEKFAIDEYSAESSGPQVGSSVPQKSGSDITAGDGSSGKKKFYGCPCKKGLTEKKQKSDYPQKDSGRKTPPDQPINDQVGKKYSCPCLNDKIEEVTCIMKIENTSLTMEESSVPNKPPTESGRSRSSATSTPLTTSSDESSPNFTPTSTSPSTEPKESTSESKSKSTDKSKRDKSSSPINFSDSATLSESEGNEDSDKSTDQSIDQTPQSSSTKTPPSANSENQQTPSTEATDTNTTQEDKKDKKDKQSKSKGNSSDSKKKAPPQKQKGARPKKQEEKRKKEFGRKI